jgi:hypothetical protein
MNKILVITAIFMTSMTNAQNNTNIVGSYKLGSSLPEVGGQLFVLEDGIYAIPYFGGIQIGHWEFIEDGVCEFSPNIREKEFELFGRHNKTLNDGVKISFNGFEEGETYLRLGTEKQDEYTMTRVFNSGANCFSYPYTHMFKTVANTLSFLSIDHYEKNNPIVTFENPNGYNDFVAYFFKEDDYAEPFYAKVKEDRLYFDDDKYSQKTPLEEDDEDTKFIKDFVDKEMNKDKLYINPFYNFFEGDINKSHVFNEQKGAFIHEGWYVEGEELVESDDSFDKMAIIYSFEILKNYTIETAKYKTDENSLFYVTCD